jgi:hypothetical protein
VALQFDGATYDAHSHVASYATDQIEYETISGVEFVRRYLMLRDCRLITSRLQGIYVGTTM